VFSFLVIFQRPAKRVNYPTLLHGLPGSMSQIFLDANAVMLGIGFESSLTPLIQLLADVGHGKPSANRGTWHAVHTWGNRNLSSVLPSRVKPPQVPRQDCQ